MSPICTCQYRRGNICVVCLWLRPYSGYDLVFLAWEFVAYTAVAIALEYSQVGPE